MKKPIILVQGAIGCQLLWVNRTKEKAARGRAAKGHIATAPKYKLIIPHAI